MVHLPSSSSPIVAHQQHIRDENNNGDFFLSSAAKSRHTTRLQRTNSHLDKAPGTVGFSIPMRSESYRSSHVDYGIRPRHTSSKQRSYVNSKASSHEMNNGETYLNSTQDETIHSQQQQQQQQNTISNNQRLNVSSFDLTTSRKALSPNKSISFNVGTNGAPQHGYHNSTHELHRSETNIDRNNLTRFALRGTVSKDHLLTAGKYRQASSIPATSTPAGAPTSITPAVPHANDRHPSAQSYKSRDPNVSYAYTDVKKYIEENELMSAEKEQIIRNWVLDVEKYRHQLHKIE